MAGAVRLGHHNISLLRHGTLICTVVAMTVAAPVFAKDQIKFEVLGSPPGLIAHLQHSMSPLAYDGKPERADELQLSSDLRLRDALQAYGYYSAKFKSKKISRPHGDILIQYQVSPGKPIRVRQRSIRIDGPGSKNPWVMKRIGPFPLSDAAVLDQLQYEQWKGDATSIMQNAGYIHAHYTRHEILVDRKAYWADIYLWLNSGKRYRIGKIQIIGANNYPRWFIDRYLTFKSGDWYFPAALANSQSNLHDADRFTNIRVTGDTQNTVGDTVPVAVHLASLPTQHLKVGAGYSTDIGPNGILDYDNYDMFDRAQHLRISAQVAQKTRVLGFDYIWPVGAALGSEYSAKASYQTQSYQVWSASAIHAAVGRTWALTNNARKNRNATIQLAMNLEKASYDVSGEVNNALYIYPSLTWRYQNYRDILRPVSGYYVTVTAEGSSKVLGSTSNFVRGRVHAGWNTLLTPQWGLGLRASLGALWLQGSIRYLPPDLRFFAGGQNSLPGYAFESQGPSNANGGVIGGRYLAVGGVDLQRFLSKDWAVVAFYDAGNAFDQFSNLHLLQDVGIGARWYSPVGPIRLDLAHPLIAPRAPAVRVVLSVGFNL